MHDLFSPVGVNLSGQDDSNRIFCQLAFSALGPFVQEVFNAPELISHTEPITLSQACPLCHKFAKAAPSSLHIRCNNSLYEGFRISQIGSLQKQHESTNISPAPDSLYNSTYISWLGAVLPIATHFGHSLSALSVVAFYCLMKNYQHTC